MKKIITHITRYFTNLTLKAKIKWGVAVLLFIIFWLSLPKHLFETPTCFVITDKDGNLLNASIAKDGQWRFPYNRDVPDKFAQCITTFEDKRFFHHPGVDPMAMGRAIWQNIRNKDVVSGGSTLTMQVIRMSRGGRSRNIWNKMSEAVLAIRLECSYKKKSILALYASNAPFGTNVVGLDAAAWRYYGRSPQQLSWGEMAALAVLPNAPSLVHPGRNTKELLRKRNELLDKLVAGKKIDAGIGELAKLEPLPGAPKSLPQLAPHLLERFKKDYVSFKNDNDELASTGVTTTIDINIQRQVNDIVLQHYRQLRANQINNAAAMVMDVESGNILAYVGNVYQPYDSAIEIHVDVLASKRSPGSTLKPLLYASLLNEGRFLPRQLVPDIPTQINGYMPENFDLGYDGAVPANRALARSLNIPAVKMLQQYKYQRFYEVLKQCGFSTLNKSADYYGMSLILGGCEVSPFELAGVYSSMARMYLHEKTNKENWNSEDWHMPLYMKREKADVRIEISNHQPPTTNYKLFDYPSLYHTFSAMNEVMRPGEEGLWGLFSSAQRIAWKTGTSFGFRDGWAVGFTKKYCIIVWAGNTTGEGRPNLTGINTAAPIMFELFRLLPASKWFDEPSAGFIAVPVCRQSGYKAGTDCPEVDNMLVSENAKNAPVCPYHRIIHLDRTGTYRVTENCESPAAMLHQPWFILPPTIEYYYRQKHAEYKILPSFMPGCLNETIKPLDIVYPGEGARIYVPVELSGQKGNTVFTATHRNSNGKLFWHLDDEYIGQTIQFHQMPVNPTAGKHVLTIVDEDGETVTRNFEIMDKKERR